MTNPAPRTDRFRQQWDRSAANFDRKIAGVDRQFLADSRAWACSRAQGRTLEVAIGTGLNLPHYPWDIELSAVDWSPAMVSIAKARAAELGRPINARVGDAMRLPFRAREFDTVVCTFSLCCIPDDRVALIEAARVLRPGGRLLIADHVASTSWPVRVLQGALELATVPLQGEHWRRRPSQHLAALGFRTLEADRLTVGIIERVHAVLP